jgi:hypothetical protein
MNISSYQMCDVERGTYLSVDLVPLSSISSFSIPALESRFFKNIFFAAN